MLTVDDLQPADILLSTGNADYSAVIRAGTLSRFSHATLYIGGGLVVEAIARGVTLQSLDDAIADDTQVSVYRRLRMSSAQAQQVVRYVKSKVGTKYDFAGAVGSGASRPSGYAIGVFISPIVAEAGVAADRHNRGDPEARFYCSELVALAFESANVPLGDKGASTAPGDIARSHVLNCVGELQRGPLRRIEVAAGALAGARRRRRNQGAGLGRH